MAPTYVLGPFRLDAKAEILFRGAEPVALGKRAVALLGVLVEADGGSAASDLVRPDGYLGWHRRFWRDQGLNGCLRGIFGVKTSH